METLPKKSWSPDMPSSKKYLSRLFTHRLSSRLNPSEFEVAFEIPLHKDYESEPDVVVFDRLQNGSAVMALEICQPPEIHDMLIIARDMMEKNSLLDFFLYDQVSNNWYNIRKNEMGYSISSNNFFKGVCLGKLREAE